MRLTVDRNTGRVPRRTLSDLPFDFPQVDWDRAGEWPERFVFGTSIHSEGSSLHSEVIRLDLGDGDLKTFREAQYVFGESLFVGAPDRKHEGDGVLTVGSSEHGAALFVLDATTLDVLAHADVHTHLPLGFHGKVFGDLREEQRSCDPSQPFTCFHSPPSGWRDLAA